MTRYSSARHLSRANLASLQPPRNLEKDFSRWQRVRCSMACSHYGGAVVSNVEKSEKWHGGKAARTGGGDEP